MAFFCKSYENVLIWVFLHAELISALKNEPKSMVFEKHAKLEKNIYHHYFLFFVIFSRGHKQKCLIPSKTCFLDGKKPNIAKLVDIKFWPITRKIYENVLILVFLHAEFISALKTEPKSMVFEKHAKNEKKKYLSSLFSIFCDFL